MADISKITLPSGNSYDIKDITARAGVQETKELIAELMNYTEYLGVTTTTLVDGVTTSPDVVIAGETVTAVSGDVVTDSNGVEFIYNGTVWQKFGDLSGLGEMAFVNKGTVTIQPKGSNAASAVSFAAHTTASVLKDTVTATVPKAAGTTKYLTASASGAEVQIDSTTNAVTGYASPTTDTFVKSYPGSTKKLATTSIPNVTNAGTAASWSATVSNETLTFAWTANTPATLGTAITAATGKVASSDTNGDDVLVGLGTATTESAIKALGTPSTEAVAKTISVKTQPSVTLTGADSTSTGAVSYVSAVGESGTNSVTFNTTNNTAAAITALGAATAAAQTFTGTSESYDVDPKTT